MSCAPPLTWGSSQLFDPHSGDSSVVTCQGTDGYGHMTWTNGHCGSLAGEHNYSAQANFHITQIANLQQVGCSDWSSCSFAWADGSPNTFTGQVGAYLGDACYGCNFQGVISRTVADPTYREACCFGAIADQRCAPQWCPSDPAGECAALFAAQCVGASDCGRHKFLTPSYTSNQGGAPCNAWYLGVKANAEQGYYTASLPPPAWASFYSVTAEVARYCAAEGAAAGECSCYNAYVACTAAEGGCLIAADTGDGRDVARRVDVYCTSAFSTTSADGSWVTLSDVCSNSPSYGAPTLNPRGANPYTPPSGVDPFPLHCWLPACQAQADDCIFKNLADVARACPPVCMQFASSANVIITNTTTPAVHVNVDAVTCGAWDGVGTASVPPLAWPSSFMAVSVPAGYATSFTVPLVNSSRDTAPGFSSVTAHLWSTVEPLLTPASTDAVGVPNGSTTAMWVHVDAGGLQPLQFYRGLLAAVDASGANPPAILPFDLDVLGASARASVDITGTAFSPPVTPSTRVGAPRIVDATPRVAAPRGASHRIHPALRTPIKRIVSSAKPQVQAHPADYTWVWYTAALAAVLAAVAVWAVLRRRRGPRGK